MTQPLERLRPILTRIPGADLPVGALQSVFIAASQRTLMQLERALSDEIRLLNDRVAGGTVTLDHEYIQSQAFTANVMQALRAAEIAESERKLRFIACALTGCTVLFPAPQVDRFQTLRVIEGLSERELQAFAELYQRLDPINPYADALPARRIGSVPGFSHGEFGAALHGLQQLGLLTREHRTPQDPWSGQPGEPEWAWTLTPLAQSVARLCRLEGDLD